MLNNWRQQFLQLEFNVYIEFEDSSLDIKHRNMLIMLVWTRVRWSVLHI